MKHNINSFLSDLEMMDIHLSEKQIDQFMTYYELLIEWNEVMNLTSITDFDEVCKKHFVDSMSFVKILSIHDLNDQNIKMIDIGTGAGFPGIPLAILFPNLKITLLDSLNKRINFLNEVIEKLGLVNCNTLHGRAEDFAKPDKLREQYDYCVSRAVSNLSTLCEYCLPYVKVGGSFISYKSEKINEESLRAEHSIKLLGGKVNQSIEFYLPNSDLYRCLFVINKVNTTPDKYPRKAGMPLKKPL